MAGKSTSNTETIQVPALKQYTATLRVIGTTPLFQNRMTEKYKQEMVIGSQPKTAAERKDIRHHPIQEFQDAAERIYDPEAPTALGMRVVAVKAAMCDAAIETAGLTKASTQRLLFMPGDHVPLYGIPQLRMDVTRMANMQRTPDIRSRPYLPRWGFEIDIRYVAPQLNNKAVVTLLCNAGILIGLGDYRQQKGKGSFGAFRVIGPKVQDEEWNDLVANHGREAQLAALEDPEPANEETAELLASYRQEVIDRGAEVVDIAGAAA